MGKSSDGMNENRPLTGNGHGINPELHEDYRSSSEIRREIERTRADMDQTVRDIRRKLSPQQISEFTFDTVQDFFSKNGPKILDSVRRNPTPIAVVGAGLGWMIYEMIRGPRSHREYGETLYTATGEPYYAGEGYMAGEFFGEGEFIGGDEGMRPGFWSKARRRAARMKSKGSGALRGAAHNITEKASDVAHNISEKAGDVAHNLGERAGHVGHGIGERASHVAQGITHGAGAVGRGIGHGAGFAAQKVTSAITTAGGATGRAIKTASVSAGHAAKTAGATVSRSATRAGHAVQEGYDRNPILMGALALIGTAALAMSLPPSKAESKLMGDQADHLLNRARNKADRALGRAIRSKALKNLAESATQKVREGREKLESARQQGWSGQNVHGTSPTAMGSDFQSGAANQDIEGKHGGTSYHAGY